MFNFQAIRRRDILHKVIHHRDILHKVILHKVIPHKVILNKVILHNPINNNKMHVIVVLLKDGKLYIFIWPTVPHFLHVFAAWRIVITRYLSFSDMFVTLCFLWQSCSFVLLLFAWCYLLTVKEGRTLRVSV